MPRRLLFYLPYCVQEIKGIAKKFCNLLRPHLKVMKWKNMTTMFTFVSPAPQANRHRQDLRALLLWVQGYLVVQQQLQKAMAKSKRWTTSVL